MNLWLQDHKDLQIQATSHFHHFFHHNTPAMNTFKTIFQMINITIPVSKGYKKLDL